MGSAKFSDILEVLEQHGWVLSKAYADRRVFVKAPGEPPDEPLVIRVEGSEVPGEHVLRVMRVIGLAHEE